MKTVSSLTREQIDNIVERVVLDVAEIPDRNSPDDQPEMMLVTGEELGVILERHLSNLLPDPCETCNGRGEIGGHVGQTPES